VLVYPDPAVTKSVEVRSPAITWFNKTCCNKATGTSSKVAKPLSAKNVANASFVGAKTR
jgi:hypothetical protein